MKSELERWKMQHCNDSNIMEIQGICHNIKHQEVTFGQYQSCAGCPYYIDEE